jgi:hypothetical protein
MEISAGFAEAMAELEDNAGVVTWNGADYPVWPGSAVRGKDLGAGGFKLRADLRFVVRAGVFPDPGPQLKQKVTYLGEEYRIDTIEKVPGETFVRFECNDPNQGA